MNNLNADQTAVTMDPAYDLWLGAAVPRYTSYPPTTAFHEGVGAEEYAAALSRLPVHEPVSLYVHIPFCDSLCLYCGCNTGVTHRADRITRYLEALGQEMRLVAGLVKSRLPLRHLHFGGGTPNILSPEMMRDIFAQLRQHFDLTACKEIAVELDPRIVTQEKVNILAECGVTRASLGIQDFKDDVQELVQRIQPFGKVADVCAWLRASGISNINFDLMYGLPLQTPESVAETARQVCGLAPARIALFSYAHLPRLKKHQKVLELHGIPDPLTRLAMDDAARQVFAGTGYVPVGMDHFAKPGDGLVRAMLDGRLKRNFQGYTDDAAEALIAFGPSSISQLQDGFFQNERLTDPYQACVHAGKLAASRGYLLKVQDRLRGAIIERLMCDLACDIGAVCKQYGVAIDAFAPEFKKLEIFAARGLIEREGDFIRLTSPWRMAIRVICHVFDGHAAAAPSGFSRVA